MMTGPKGCRYSFENRRDGLGFRHLCLVEVIAVDIVVTNVRHGGPISFPVVILGKRDSKVEWIDNDKIVGGNERFQLPGHKIDIRLPDLDRSPRGCKDGNCNTD